MATGRRADEGNAWRLNQDVWLMKTLIVLGGAEPSPSLLASQLDWAERVIAVDHGVDCMVAVGCRPDVLVGDLDSVQTPIQKLTCPIEQSDDKYSTDFEKGLRIAGVVDCLHILGGLGERTDHLLTNLHIAAGIDSSADVVFLGDAEAIHRVTPVRPFRGALPIGSTISLLPFSICERVDSTGLRWNLSQTDMGTNLQLGQSNVVEQKGVEIAIGSGIMYVSVLAST